MAKPVIDLTQMTRSEVVAAMLKLGATVESIQDYLMVVNPPKDKPTVTKDMQLRTRRDGRFGPSLRKWMRRRRTKPILGLKAYNPRQPRWGKGRSTGGQWKPSGGVSGDIFTGRSQGAARRTVQDTERIIGRKLPPHGIRVKRGLATDGLYTGHTLWVSPKDRHPHMTTAHEIGHLLDHKGFKRRFGSDGSADFRHFNRVVDRTQMIKQWRGWQRSGYIASKGNLYTVHPATYRYVLNRREIFARAFAQRVARRSGNRRMRNELRVEQRSHVSYHWSDRDFRSVDKALSRLLKSQGYS